MEDITALRRIMAITPRWPRQPLFPSSIRAGAATTAPDTTGQEPPAPSEEEIRSLEAEKARRLKVEHEKRARIQALQAGLRALIDSEPEVPSQQPASGTSND